MQIPLKVTFRNLEHSDFIEAHVRDRAGKLETFSRRITRCHVVVEAPHRHQHGGRHFRIGIDLSLPGAELVVSRAPGDKIDNEDLYAAIDKAFDQMGRKVEDHVRRQRGDVKTHLPMARLR